MPNVAEVEVDRARFATKKRGKEGLTTLVNVTCKKEFEELLNQGYELACTRASAFLCVCILMGLFIFPNKL